ncbi:hypothetical protein G7K71_02755 [Desulfofundulus sp. TPOSR]|uniref:DUF6927 domain-containing protein n=1 Tax=Desulfofundulus sp. TPOSR TaxID=2714340 RepID=UPI00140A32CF|nr:hypothetical protein [Desulfofundulus sp. TPOSR]NHM25946.1 hypothetical protein [Desulfofundulus sp. TPOSR]
MGWTFTQKYHGESIKEFFKKEFDYRRDDGRYGRVIDCAVVNLSTAYIAYEMGDGTGKREVTAIVCLLRFVPNAPDGCNFGYKDMTENMHPYYYDCPERILKLLTPTDNESALRWREKCWENIRTRKARPRLVKGAVIEFTEPITFRSGRQERTFRVIDPRRLVFESGGMRFKLRRSTLREREWKLVQGA